MRGNCLATWGHPDQLTGVLMPQGRLLWETLSWSVDGWTTECEWIEGYNTI
jgi:hypothetical protein